MEKRQFQGDLITGFQYLKGAVRRLEKVFSEGHVVIAQGIMASDWRGDSH